ncbi:MAG: YbhB/YbcL family Raf kinase inhibitor-like protein [Caulobacteraceae bacterium]|nr:YbhB/YbcL family Raf kinase inhibitor-like protein [Caulobacter sp.]
MLEKMPAAIGEALQGVRPGLDKTVWAEEGLQAPETVKLESEAFSDGGAIPAAHTEDGDKSSPPLAYSSLPDAVASVLLVVEDADSPTPAPFVHLLAYGLPAEDRKFAAGVFNGGTGEAPGLGYNTLRKLGWLPPDPPPGHGAHRYVFQVYALGRDPGLAGEVEKKAVVAALKGNVLARGRLIGTYERKA